MKEENYEICFVFCTLVRMHVCTCFVLSLLCFSVPRLDAPLVMTRDDNCVRLAIRKMCVSSLFYKPVVQFQCLICSMGRWGIVTS